ncbi:MAG: class I SAM-dependent methyltransferase [Thermofilaceae archaeon]
MQHFNVKRHPFKNKRMRFIKRNVLNTVLPSNIFDAIIMVFTVERRGLDVYEQPTLNDEDDIKAMRELHRVMKPNGLLILTTLYTGQTLRITEFERNYNRQRLTKLIKGFKVVKEEYFYPERVGNRLARNKIIQRTSKNKQTIDSIQKQA